MQTPSKADSKGLKAVMDWLFDKHSDKDRIEKENLNIDRFLKMVYVDDVVKSDKEIDEAIEKIAGEIALQSKTTLTPLDKTELKEIIRGGNGYNAVVTSMKTIRFMKELIHRESTIPPPWRA